VVPWNPSQTWVPHPPRTHGGRREFDLDLKFFQRWFKEILKNGKPVHGVMICDVVPRKIPNMAFQGFIEKLFTKNATKYEFTRLSTHVTMVFETSIAKF
jgi:hypothetical protein